MAIINDDDSDGGSSSKLFVRLRVSVPAGRGVGMCKLGAISQERLRVEVKLLLSANRKSYMPRRSAQQRMTSSDLVIGTQRSIAGFVSYRKAQPLIAT